jgi:hypothetical protein
MVIGGCHRPGGVRASQRRGVRVGVRGVKEESGAMVPIIFPPSAHRGWGVGQSKFPSVTPIEEVSGPEGLLSRLGDPRVRLWELELDTLVPDLVPPWGLGEGSGRGTQGSAGNGVVQRARRKRFNSQIRGRELAKVASRGGIGRSKLSVTGARGLEKRGGPLLAQEIRGGGSVQTTEGALEVTREGLQLEGELGVRVQEIVQ